MTETNDTALIEKAVWLYLNGQNNRDHTLVEQAWHKDCHMFGLNDKQEIVTYPLSIWKEWFSKPSDDPDAKIKSEILSMDIYKTAANVKVRTVIDGSKGTIIWTDYLNLLKVADDEWRIINKIYHTDFTPKP